MSCSTALLGSSIHAAAPAISFRGSSSNDGHGGHRAVPGCCRMLRKCGVAAWSPPDRPWQKLGGGLGRRRSVRRAATEGSEKTDKKVPAWADPDAAEPPPWAKNERGAAAQEPPQELPFYVYLIGSVLVAIAAVGSVFEYYNQNPAFGVVYPDNPAYAPLLGFLAITGVPSTLFLLFKAISLANKASEEADEQDGFRR